MLIVVIFNETRTTTSSCNYTMFHACFVLFCDCNLLKQRIQSRNSLASSLSKLQKMNFMWIIIIFIHSFAISKPFFFSSLYSYLLLVLCYCYMFVCFQKKIRNKREKNMKKRRKELPFLNHIYFSCAASCTR
jgi:ATP/ADP translocase